MNLVFARHSNDERVRQMCIRDRLRIHLNDTTKKEAKQWPGTQKKAVTKT